MKLSFMISAVCIAFVFVSCNNEKKSSEVSTATDSSTIVENVIMRPEATCYFYTKGRDTVQLRVEDVPNGLTGKLVYNLYEKDSNNGSFAGKLSGDTLLADYSFMSEGLESKRQIVFLIKDGKATEGYGSMEEKDGKMIFKNLQDITFGKGIVLSKADCGDF